MDIVLCGLSHKTAPVEILEKLAFTSNDHVQALTQLASTDSPHELPISEAIILSTCNRVELYAVMPDGRAGPEPIARFLAEFHHVPPPVLAPHLYSRQGEEAVQHLFTVAAGLDSMIVGEPQILGQVRTAFEEASVLGAAGPVLSALFRHAIRVGKRVRTETSISQRAVSISYAAVELARRLFGELHDCQVLIVGAGETGQLTARCLMGRGARGVIVVNRSYDRALALARQWDGEAKALDCLEEALRRSDIVISCTDAPHYFITVEHVRRAMAPRQGRPLFLIDIAVPRDIEPVVGELPGVRLYDIDDLRAVVEANLHLRRSDGPRAKAIIAQEVVRFMAWFKALAVTPIIVNLRQQAELIRQRELERALRRLDGLSDRHLNVINLLTQRIVNQMLHEPTVRLKRYAGCSHGQVYARAIRDLFALDGADVGE